MKRMSKAGQTGRWFVAASVVIATVAATGSTAPASADTPSTISGTVSRADGGSPEGIVVATRCNDENTWPWELSTTTTAAADGSYSLPNPAGSECASVFVEFHDPTGAYVSQFYGDTLVDYEATTVGPALGDTVLAPQILSHVAGAIRGRVFDTYGHRVHDREIQVHAGSDVLEDTIALPSANLGPKGGFVLRSLLPGARYFVDTTDGSRYSSVSTRAQERRWLPVAAGKTAVSPRLVVKDRPRISLRATWHAHSVTFRIRVVSRVTGKFAPGTVWVSLGKESRSHIRLRHGRATVTVPAVFPREWAAVDLGYDGSRHVAAHAKRSIYRF
jgi:hypothetical protein